MAAVQGPNGLVYVGPTRLPFPSMLDLALVSTVERLWKVICPCGFCESEGRAAAFQTTNMFQRAVAVIGAPVCTPVCAPAAIFVVNVITVPSA